MTGPKRILVVDDEKDMTEYLTALLSDFGFSIRTAGNGNEARKALEAELPDLITLDVVMPDKTGVKFYRELRDNPAWRGIPVIFITGVSADFEKFIGSRKSAPAPEGFLSKPFDPDQLRALVEKLTSAKAQTA